MGARPRIEERLARRGGVVELLRVPAAVFGALATLRGALYDRGWLPVARLDVPVVSVGNLTAGGTGKTPFVAWLVRELDRRGSRPGIVSRGYGAGADGGPNDEARLLARLCPGIPHEQDPDRAAAAHRLAEAHRGVVVLDDGFQHRRLARDLDIVLVDATRPWGLPAANDAPVCAMLPRGLLRERPDALARAHAICVTRAGQVGGAELAALSAELERRAPGVPRLTADHRPRALIDAEGVERDVRELAGRTVDLVSGIGNPRAFEATVRALGAEVGEHRAFADHHRYAAGDLDGLGADGRWIVTTGKDAVKLEGAHAGLVTLDVELGITEGEAVLAALLDALPEGRRARERAAFHEGLHG